MGPGGGGDGVHPEPLCLCLPRPNEPNEPEVPNASWPICGPLCCRMAPEEDRDVVRGDVASALPVLPPPVEPVEPCVCAPRVRPKAPKPEPKPSPDVVDVDPPDPPLLVPVPVPPLLSGQLTTGGEPEDPVESPPPLVGK